MSGIKMKKRAKNKTMQTWDEPSEDPASVHANHPDGEIYNGEPSRAVQAPDPILDLAEFVGNAEPTPTLEEVLPQSGPSDVLGHAQSVAQKLSDSGPSAFKKSQTPPRDDSKFARFFTTQPLTVLVGPKRNQTAFYLHKHCLATRSKYFASLLQFPGTEARTNTVTLDTAPVDNLDAFEMFVDYLYHGTYTTPTELETGAICILHAKVYVLAERLVVEPLKTLALEKMAKELAGAYKMDDAYFNDEEGCWEVLDKALDVETVVEMVEIVYEHTKATYEENEDDEESCNCVVHTEAIPKVDVWPSVKGKEKATVSLFGGRDGADVCARDELNPPVEPPVLSEDENEAVLTEESVQPEIPVETELPTEEDPPPVQEECANDESDPLPPRDRMRKLVSRYAASQANVLKGKPKFLKVVRHWREFSEDIFLAGNNGAKVESDEIERL